jgi:hypothetical protein
MAQLSPAGNAAALRYSQAEQRFDQLAAEARKAGNEPAARGSEIHAGWAHRAALAEMRDDPPKPFTCPSVTVHQSVPDNWVVTCRDCGEKVRGTVKPDVLVVACTHPRQLAGRCLVCGEMAR